MPPKKKAAVKGPFFFFMLDYRKREEDKGKSFTGGLEQVMVEAGPAWNQLNESERDVYKERAKVYKASPKSDFGEKYTSQGIKFSAIEQHHKERNKKQDTIKKSIAEMIETAVCTNNLEKMKVFFLSFNYFCKTTTDVYVPAEMAVLKYNLEMGVLDRMHEFVDPGNLPLGLAYEANLFSEETHQLPIPPNAMGEKDFSVLLDKLLNFIDYEKKDRKALIFLTENKEVAIVESILNQFMDEADLDYNFLVCPLGEFFYQLKRATENYGLDIRTFPAKTVADILLKKDNYEYTSSIACEFHENLGNPRFCSLSKVTRWSYIISDNCCLDLSIDLIPGYHLPLNADTTLCSDLSETGTRSSQSFGDRTSFISASDVTHISLPKVHKVRSKSPFHGFADEAGSVIYSSRGGMIKNETKTEKPEVDTIISTNPFFSLDMSDPQKTLDTTVVPKEVKVYNPFSRQQKLENVRQPRDDAGVVGHGRGSLLRLASASTTAGPIFKGAGRGANLLSSVSSLTAVSSAGCNSDIDDN